MSATTSAHGRSGSSSGNCTSDMARSRNSSTIWSRPVTWLYSEDGLTCSFRARSGMVKPPVAPTSSMAADAIRSVDSSGVGGRPMKVSSPSCEEV